MQAAAALKRAPRRFLAWLIGPPEDTRADRAVRGLTVALVALGLFLRARGYLWHAPAFWLDECTWAMNLVEQPLIELSIRPIGFMWVSRTLAQLFSLTEPVLRAMPWLAGIAGVLIAPPLARRLFQNPAARLLFVFIIALHPCAIDFSKEFKPYSLSLTLHLALLLLTLRYLETKKLRELVVLLVTATVGGLFAQDLVFAYPGIFLVAGWTALHSRKVHLAPIAGAAGVILVLLVVQYVFIWSQNKASDTAVWASKYDVFFAGKGLGAYLSWAFERHAGMAAFPGYRRRLWLSAEEWHGVEVLRRADFLLWIVLHVLGLAVIARRRRYPHALLLVLPLGVAWAFNLLRLWPIGPFRANLFVIDYASAIACMAFDVPRRERARFGHLVPAVVLVLVPFVFLDPNHSDRKQALTYDSEFPKALKTIASVKAASDPRGREPLILDRRSCDPYRYYTEFHPKLSGHLRRLMRAQFRTLCVTDDSLYRAALMRAMHSPPYRAWTVLHDPHPVTHMLQKHELGDAELVYEDRVGPHGVMGFERQTASAPAAPRRKHATETETSHAGRPSRAHAAEEVPDVSPDGRF